MRLPAGAGRVNVRAGIGNRESGMGEERALPIPDLRFPIPGSSKNPDQPRPERGHDPRIDRLHRQVDLGEIADVVVALVEVRIATAAAARSRA